MSQITDFDIKIDQMLEYLDEVNSNNPMYNMCDSMETNDDGQNLDFLDKFLVYKNFRVQELKEICDALGLTKVGNKTELLSEIRLFFGIDETKEESITRCDNTEKTSPIYTEDEDLIEERIENVLDLHKVNSVFPATLKQLKAIDESTRLTIPQLREILVAMCTKKSAPRKADMVSMIRVGLGFDKELKTSASVKKLRKDELIDITLKPYQEKEVDDLFQALKDKSVVCEMSATGAGKTYILSALAKKMNVPIFVICPPTLKQKWELVSQSMGVEIIDIMSYQKISGSNGTISHQWLRSTDLTKVVTYKEKEQHYKSRKFEITDKLLDLIISGCLFVCDESHLTKNESTIRNKAIRCITEAVDNYLSFPDPKSRVVLCTATPADKNRCYYNLLKMMRICKSKILTTGTNNSYNQIKQLCMKYDKVKTLEIIQAAGEIKESNVMALIIDLFDKILKKYYTFEVNPDLIYNKEYKPEIRNVFSYIRDDEILKLYNEELLNLYSIIRPEVKKKFNGYNTPFGGILSAIESAKLESFYDKTVGILDKTKNVKVVIALNYTQNIDLLAENLEEYGVVTLTGQTKQHKRSEIVDSFNNDDKIRVIIINSAVGGVGIDLDDRSGDRPRVVLVSPGFSFILLQQLLGRTYRCDTQSKSFFFIIYGPRNSEISEERIVNSLNDKSKINSSLVIKQKESEAITLVENLENIDEDKGNLNQECIEIVINYDRVIRA